MNELDLADLVEELWPLSCSFEYAAEIGFSLRTLRPDWWQHWEEQTQLPHGWPLQAYGFDFLRWAETEIDSHVLGAVIVAALGRSPARLRVELEASRACIDRDLTPKYEDEVVDVLEGQAVRLWKPVASAGYPAGLTEHLDLWTQRALFGADITYPSSSPARLIDLMEIHSPSYVQGLINLAEAGGGQLTPETWVSEEAADAILQSCGALFSATTAAMSGDDKRIPLVLSRPGSHHAERGRGGGTCLVNNLAVSAIWALKRGARRIAIFDVDAHHGNGTEDCFREMNQVLTVSVHQSPPFFPGTGYASDRGSGAGKGKNLNLPVSAHSSGEEWQQAAMLGIAEIKRHKPDIIFVQFSADAHRADPVSDLNAEDEHFEAVIQALEALGAPVVYELGASLSERAWTGAIRSLVKAAATSPRRK